MTLTCDFKCWRCDKTVSRSFNSSPTFWFLVKRILTMFRCLMLLTYLQEWQQNTGAHPHIVPSSWPIQTSGTAAPWAGRRWSRARRQLCPLLCQPALPPARFAMVRSCSSMRTPWILWLRREFQNFPFLCSWSDSQKSTSCRSPHLMWTPGRLSFHVLPTSSWPCHWPSLHLLRPRWRHCLLGRRRGCG